MSAVPTPAMMAKRRPAEPVFRRPEMPKVPQKKKKKKFDVLTGALRMCLLLQKATWRIQNEPGSVRLPSMSTIVKSLVAVRDDETADDIDSLILASAGMVGVYHRVCAREIMVADAEGPLSEAGLGHRWDEVVLPPVDGVTDADLEVFQDVLDSSYRLFGVLKSRQEARKTSMSQHPSVRKG